MKAAARLALAAQILRHAIILGNVEAAARRIRRTVPVENAGGPPVAVVLPMLREQRLVAETVEHFRGLLRGGDQLLVVTSARETAGSGPTTSDLASRLCNGRHVRHLHLSDPAGRKGDQVNLAAAALAGDGRDWLVVVYDADSRPPRGSLSEFAALAAAHPYVNVFHQSARFEVRGRPGALQRALADAGALRANRFVLAYELPRLLSRAPAASRRRRLAARLTYGHVSGHGLGVRAAYLRHRPLPARTTMEDMYWSFGLAAEGVPIVPLHSLDRSEVPTPFNAQLRQARRWFAGPGRAAAYLVGRRGAMRPGDVAVAASALLISAEWLSCAAAPPALAALVRSGGTDRLLGGLFTGIYAIQLVVCAKALLPPGRRWRAVAVFPVVNTGFGLAGWAALAGAGANTKTER